MLYKILLQLDSSEARAHEHEIPPQVEHASDPVEAAVSHQTVTGHIKYSYDLHHRLWNSAFSQTVIFLAL